MTFILLAACITCLVLLITWVKLNPFLAFLIVGTLAALLLGMPLDDISKSVNKGIGDTLGSLVIVIALGAMLGKLVAESGAAQRITLTMQQFFGARHLVWAMSLTGFLVGIPLYYNVGFVLMIPIIFSVAYQYKLPLIYVGLPMLASLSVMHGFLPPHPSPLALVTQFNADITTTFGYGIIIAIPAIIIAGPLFARTVASIQTKPPTLSLCADRPHDTLPGTVNSLISSLLPVVLIGLTTLLSKIFAGNQHAEQALLFIAEPNQAMLLTIVIVTYTLGIRTGKKLSSIMMIYAEAVKDIAMILLIIGSAGILKQILFDSGVSDEIADAFKLLDWPPLVLAWVVTAVLRLALGSATIAGLTAAGVVYPLTQHMNIDPNLLVLSIGAGSLFCSHVNDTAFWLFKEYFGLTIKDTFRSWTIMETIVSIIGLIGVLALDYIIQ
ncbi:gluconate:H+ symporter [Pseudochryseolinea flava]|uniref:Gluconate transporter n=1 Tax=Pseudochryseolinea flava TaxID=2059302 RepID=A0A364XZL5_9BACT|nr:gluconate:H+ symporter [Pseudochryseolinea flava]RAV98912.1 gluconate transporter [Pseudochryseolinea flava]